MNCPACDSCECEYNGGETRELKRVQITTQYEFYSCTACKSSFVEPREIKPAESYAEQGEFYRWRWDFEELIHDLEGIPTPPRRILEVGCGEGILLEKLAHGYEAWGLDFNREAVNAARSKGLKAFPCTVGEFRVLHAEILFDAVALFHVIEHVAEPFLFLKEIREVLVKGGRLFISVPNPDRYNLKFEREVWDFPPHHITRFSKAGISSLLKRAGFEICKTADQPMGRPSGRSMIHTLKNYYYKRVPLPKVVRQTLKVPIFMLLHFYAMHLAVSLSRNSTEQSFYLMAKRNETYRT